MASPTPEPADGLSGAALAELRHDLRTPINHILGYTEMLLEDAQGPGGIGESPGLRETHSIGKQLLSEIANVLAPSQASVEATALRALASRLLPLVGRIESLVAPLSTSARPGTQREDLQRVLAAARSLQQLVQRGLTSRVQPPSSSSASTASASSSTRAVQAARRIDMPAGRILVVDDIDTNRDILTRRLEREGHRVEAAANGRQALEMIDQGNFDLVLLDIMMPEIDGYEVLAQLKASPTLRDLPVVMISALDELQSVVRCIEMGAEDYLPKPFDPVLLRARVDACLEKKRLRDLELEYLRNVAVVTQSATDLEAGNFDRHTLDAVAARPDELGRLASVFQHMAGEVQARVDRLKQEVRQLRIEIDQGRKAEHVAEITESDYFQHLQQRAQELRRRAREHKE